MKEKERQMTLKKQSIKQGKVSVSFDFNGDLDEDNFDREAPPYNGRDFIKRNKLDVSSKGSLSLGRLKKYKDNATPN